uniref:Uncharacterized protein n=1 Tax=Romanomermis culicivorax TaxID=13658 RepID=A0A915KGN4_ROMCU
MKSRQCDKAVIRVYDDTDPSGKEFCGDVIKNPGVRQFVSSNETLYIKLRDDVNESKVYIHIEMIDAAVGVSAHAALLEIGKSTSIIFKWLKKLIVKESLS